MGSNTDGTTQTSDFDSREEAYRRLLKIEEKGSFIGLDADATGVAARTKRQAMEYVAGITRWRRRLDHILSHYYRGDYAGVELRLKVVLRIGLYDILFLDTPSYAAVNESVRLAKHRIRRGAGGLVNGILRSVLRERDRLPVPSTGDAADDLAVMHSHPTWMVKRWLKRYGLEDAEALLTSNNTRPTYGVRVNTLKIEEGAFLQRLDDLGVPWEESRFLPHFIRVSSVQPLLEHGLLREGLCSVQDESAGLIVSLLDPQPHETVIDLCAAPGGKTLHAAQRMNNHGRIRAVDIHEGRLRLVSHSARTAQASMVETVHTDARTFGSDGPQADRVLVDAPCSGLGVLSKRADLRWRRSPEDLVELTALQDEILDAAAKLVRPGGVLVYGTCTIEPEENEERVRAFLNRHGEFRLEDARPFVPPRLVDEQGFYATFPPRDDVDGAFAARLVREESTACVDSRRG